MSVTILNVSQNYFMRGGSDRYFFGLGEMLQQHGHTVIPFTSRQPLNLPNRWSDYFPAGVNFEAPGIRDVVRYVYSRSAATALRRLLKTHPVDLAHLHIYYGQLTGAILPVLRDAGVPIVQTLHDFKLVCPVYSLQCRGQVCEACRGHQFWRASVRRCNRGSLARSALSTIESYASRLLGSIDLIDHFISVSNFQRQKLIELGVPSGRISTIYNYANTRSFGHPTTPGDYLLYFGRIELLKGVISLVEAARRSPGVRLVIAGHGEAVREIQSLVTRHRVTNIELVGFKQGQELEQLVRGSIATILPSVGYDNCPMAILESYTFGKPVIGARIGGIPELITDGVDGFVFSPGDSDALAALMVWMNEHREQAVTMGMAGLRKVRNQFNSRTHFQRIAAVYASLGVPIGNA